MYKVREYEGMKVLEFDLRQNPYKVTLADLNKARETELPRTPEEKVEVAFTLEAQITLRGSK